MGAAGGRGALLGALLGVALAAATTPEPPVHSLAEVLFCQPDAPSLGLALTFDDEQLFWFDAPSSRWQPRLPDFPPWPEATEPPSELVHDTTLCQELLQLLTRYTTQQMPMPEAKGIPVANVFLKRPLELGWPNTLVCMVGNIFPPAVTISWQRDGVPVTEGVTTTTYTPVEDLGFVRFSYLRLTPRAGDVYSCIVTRERDNTSVLTYWVPQDPVPSDVLATALCGAAVALGILLALVGLVLLAATRRHRRG
ncbi:class II histocompatibility antigen, M alpha chain [Oxyura jamaicensis]|uniref:class II histocompatibility antigen, M alpha chain n=1 Tax=Oxyura jamaicensis TaxID=8884 RepID=UPI0015A66E4C|nr:class II histocompatibility antigen, M alpha chain [Oxyura jamaicensis]